MVMIALSKQKMTCRPARPALSRQAEQAGQWQFVIKGKS
jgi:hypothetical protein